MTERGPRRKKPLAVIVDDQAEQRTLIRRRIETACDVLEAGSSEEALAIVGTHPVDIVFTDSNLPNFDGKELCRRLRLTYLDRHLIVFVTASAAHPGSEMEMIDAGADGILGKPFNAEHLHAILRQVAGIVPANEATKPEPVLGRRQTRSLTRRVFASLQSGLTNRASKPDVSSEDDDPSFD